MSSLNKNYYYYYYVRRTKLQIRYIIHTRNKCYLFLTILILVIGSYKTCRESTVPTLTCLTMCIKTVSTCATGSVCQHAELLINPYIITCSYLSTHTTQYMYNTMKSLRIIALVSSVWPSSTVQGRLEHTSYMDIQYIVIHVHVHTKVPWGHSTSGFSSVKSVSACKQTINTHSDTGQHYTLYQHFWTSWSCQQMHTHWIQLEPWGSVLDIGEDQIMNTPCWTPHMQHVQCIIIASLPPNILLVSHNISIWPSDILIHML